VSKIAHKEGEFLFSLFRSLDWEKSLRRRSVKASGAPILGIRNSASSLAALDDRSTMHKKSRTLAGTCQCHRFEFLISGDRRRELLDEILLMI
jgi:hypothetical protein